MSARAALQSLTSAPLTFRRTGEALVPWACEAEGRRLRVRVNDFPAEPLYTLLVDDEPAFDLDEWPPAWRRPT